MGLTFIEAVTALKDGRCEGITRRLWMNKHDTITIDNMGLLVNRFGMASIHPDNILADDWQLVNERPQTEEVEVVVYAAVCNESGIVAACIDDDHEYKDFVGGRESEYTCVKLTGTRTRPTLPKKKRRERIGTAASSVYEADYMRKDVPAKADIFAEWEE